MIHPKPCFISSNIRLHIINALHEQNNLTVKLTCKKNMWFSFNGHFDNIQKVCSDLPGLDIVSPLGAAHCYIYTIATWGNI